MKIITYKNDLPDNFGTPESIAIDSETMGLNPFRDRLCVVQLSTGDGVGHLVKFDNVKPLHAPNLCKLLSNEKVLKIFHFGRFDIAMIKQHLGITCRPVYCTKIASKLIRTYTNKHSLRELCSLYAKVDLSKQEQTSDWGTETLTESQGIYAANDVLYLHKIKKEMDLLLKRENRQEIAQQLFNFLPTVAELDLLRHEVGDIFAHN